MTLFPTPPTYGQAPPLTVPVHVIGCRFGCTTVVASEDLQAAREAMEAHYEADHPQEVAAA